MKKIRCKKCNKVLNSYDFHTWTKDDGYLCGECDDTQKNRLFISCGFIKEIR